MAFREKKNLKKRNAKFSHNPSRHCKNGRPKKNGHLHIETRNEPDKNMQRRMTAPKTLKEYSTILYDGTFLVSAKGVSRPVVVKGSCCVSSNGRQNMLKSQLADAR